MSGENEGAQSAGEILTKEELVNCTNATGDSACLDRGLTAFDLLAMQSRQQPQSSGFLIIHRPKASRGPIQVS